MGPDSAHDLPSIDELRRALIPAPGGGRWDVGELPRAVLHLDDQTTLGTCDVLLRLAVVVHRALDGTRAARAVALREVICELLPKGFDHPFCFVLRALAGLEQGTAGRRREQREEVAGRALGPAGCPIHTRSVRRRVREDCWPWLLDRLIEQEVQARRSAQADSPETADRRAGVVPTSSAQQPADRLLASGIPSVGVDALDHIAAALGSRSGAPASTCSREARSARDAEPVLDAFPGALPVLLVVDTRVFLEALGTVAPDQHPRWWLPLALHSTTSSGTLGSDMKRRAFLFGAPAAVILSRLGLAQSAGASVPNEAILDDLVAAIAAEKRLCHQLGSRAVHSLAAEHVQLATDLLRNSSRALRPRLAAVATDAAVEAGFVCADQRQLPAAQSYYQLAAELAQEAGDPRLEGFVLGSWSRRVAETSYFRLDAAESGDAAQALPFMKRAQATAAQRSSPATSAYLATVEAEIQACTGDAGASLRAMERADEALSRTEPSEDAPWLLDLDIVSMRGSHGYCHMRMGRLDQADALLTRALSDIDPPLIRPTPAGEERLPRGRTVSLQRSGGRGRITLARDLVILAFIRLRQREIEECCRLAGEALDLSVAIGASTNLERVRDLRLQLQPWKESPAVQALDERMAATPWV